MSQVPESISWNTKKSDLQCMLDILNIDVTQGSLSGREMSWEKKHFVLSFELNKLHLKGIKNIYLYLFIHFHVGSLTENALVRCKGLQIKTSPKSDFFFF